jgi:hypothetical protein
MLQYSSMRTSDVLQAFGNDRKAIAAALDISLSAVYQWDELVPPASAMRLAAMRPEIPFDPEQYKGWDAPKRKNGKRKSH